MNIVDIAVKSLVLSAFGLVIFVLMRRSSAAARHYLLALMLFSLCALPVLAPVLPRWSVPFIRVPAPAPAVAQDVPAPALAAGLTAGPTAGPIAGPTEIAAPHAMDTETASLVLWASIAALLGLRVFTRLSRLRRLEHSLPMFAQPELQSLVAEYCRRHGRHFLLLEGESNEPPMTWGHSRPVLLLPSCAREWPSDRLQSVLLHELAHVERGDWIVSLGGELVCALFWFNPLVWVMRKRLEIESERAADDRVVAMGVSRTDYATHLVELLRDLNKFPKAADAAVGMTRPSRLDARVRSILVDREPVRAVRGSVSLGLMALVVLMVGAIGAAGPTIVRSAAPDASPSGLLAQDDVARPLLEPPAPPSVFTPEVPSRSARSTHETAPPSHARPATVSVTSTAVSPHPPATPSASTRTKSSSMPVTQLDDWGGIAKSFEQFDVPFNDNKFEAKLERATEELNRSVEHIQLETDQAGKASVDAALHSVRQIDLPDIIAGAMRAAGEGIANAKLTKEQQHAIRVQIRKSLKKALDSVPACPDDSGDSGD